jgi:hypothetical protein
VHRTTRLIDPFAYPIGSPLICGLRAWVWLVHVSTTNNQDFLAFSYFSTYRDSLLVPRTTSNMTTDDDSSDLSSLSSLSPVPSDVELDDNSDDATTKSKSGILKFFPKLSERPPPKEPSPPPRKRSPSPPHEYVLADNPDIAVSTESISKICFRRVEAASCHFLEVGARKSRRWLTMTRIFACHDSPWLIKSTNSPAVHRNVQKSIQRRILKVPGSFWASGA